MKAVQDVLMPLLAADEKKAWKIIGKFLGQPTRQGGQDQSRWAYYAGGAPVLLMAHVDTVGDRPPVPVIEGNTVKVKVKVKAEVAPPMVKSSDYSCPCANCGGLVLTHDQQLCGWQGDKPCASVRHSATFCSYYRRTGFSAWSRDVTVLGADDRAGVAGLILLSRLPVRPALLFTSGEETGGLGGRAFVNKRPEITKPRMVIQLDRRGANDWINYSSNSEYDPEVAAWLESFGFQEGVGSFSDSALLEELWPDIPIVNLSIGYQHEHSESETLSLSAWARTVKRVALMIRQVAERETDWPPNVDLPLGSYYRDDYIWDEKTQTFEDGWTVCEGCRHYWPATEPFGWCRLYKLGCDAARLSIYECPDWEEAVPEESEEIYEQFAS